MPTGGGTSASGSRAAAREESWDADDGRERRRRATRQVTERGRSSLVARHQNTNHAGHVEMDSFNLGDSVTTTSGFCLVNPHGSAAYHGVGHFRDAWISSAGIDVGIPYNAMAQPEMIVPLGYAVAHNMLVATAAVPQAYFRGPRIAPRELPPYVCLGSQKREKNENDRQEGDICDTFKDQTSLIKECEGTGIVSNSESEESVLQKKNRHKSTTVCEFFLKTGSCAYGINCKFNHPFDQAPTIWYNSMGLPRRPGEPICQYFTKRYRCAFGHTCKFDHPEPHEFPGF